MAVLGLMADPGLPERLVRQLAEELEEKLTAGTDGRDGPSNVRWDVQVSGERLPLDDEGQIPVLDRADGLRSTHGWDLLVYVTELPRTHDHQTLLTESDVSLRAALVSLPALGGLRVRRHLLAELLRVVPNLAAKCNVTGSGPTDNEHQPEDDEGDEDGQGDPWGAPSAQEEPDYRTIAGRRGRRRLLAGMIRSNRPGRLVGSLSSAAAAAMATGAFGIFYGSIWNMADSSSTLRLFLISVLAILTLTGWLIIHNGMWSSQRMEVDRTPAALDNAATVITVLLSVGAMYAALYLAVLLGSLAIIPGHYMQSQLGHPVSIAEYANLSWLSASLGMLAGALGSNFDGDTSVRKATYSGREQERRELAAQQEESSGTGQ